MKKPGYIFYLTVSCLLFAACSEDEGIKRSGSAPAPAPVDKVAAASGPGEIIVKWQNPDDENFFYVNVSYKDAKGVTHNRKTSKYKEADAATGLVADTIGGFADSNEYEFTLTACNEYGDASGPVTVTGQAGESILKQIPKTISVKDDFGGVAIGWTNNSGKEAYIIVAYADPANENRIKKESIDASKSGTVNITGLPGNVSKNFDLSVRDGFFNESEVVTYTAVPLVEIKIDKSRWSIPGYNPNSAAETIGYSSQAINEGTANKAIAIIDDNVTSTFWHASWSNPSTVYPHWIVVDMDREVTISRVELVRRPNRTSESQYNEFQTGQQILTCTEAGATDPDNSKVWAWEDQGSSSFDRSTSNPTSVRLSKNPKARYIKLYFDASVKGTSNFAQLGEITVYGAEE
ncbi:MAG: DUF4959 domain-containing protein [Prevotella sp.]|nr:DUF4959 domain-containing protein [Prevotella sp.]